MKIRKILGLVFVGLVILCAGARADETNYWKTFVNDTGTGTEIIDADEVNPMFLHLTGNQYPRETTGAKSTREVYGLGSTTYAWKWVVLNQGSTDGGAIYFDASSSKYVKASADGNALNVGGFANIRLTSTATLTVTGTTIEVSDASKDVTVMANTSEALTIKSGGMNYLNVDTTTSNETIDLMGGEILANDQQLTPSQFPNNTTLYIWNMDATTQDAVGAAYSGTLFGGKDLTVRIATLGVSLDALGETVYNYFNGAAGGAFGGNSLFNNDAAFNFTGDFSVGCWASKEVWTGGTAYGLVANRTLLKAGDDGWVLGITDGKLIFETASGGTVTSTTQISIKNLTPKWYHFAAVRKSGAWVKLFIDGVKVKTVYDATDTITAGISLEVGSVWDEFQSWKGNLDEVFIHNATCLTDDQVAKIYARTAQKFATLNQDSTVFVGRSNYAVLGMPASFEGIVCPNTLEATSIKTGPISELTAGAGVRIKGNLICENNVYTVPWTDYSAFSTITGWSSYGIKKIHYYKMGNRVFVNWVISGESNSTQIKFTLPYTASVETNVTYSSFGCYGMDNNVAVSGGCLVDLYAFGGDENKIYIYPGYGGAWTASGNKKIRGQLWYISAN